MADAWSPHVPTYVYRYNTANPTDASGLVEHAAESWMMFKGTHDGYAPAPPNSARWETYTRPPQPERDDDVHPDDAVRRRLCRGAHRLLALLRARGRPEHVQARARPCVAAVYARGSAPRRPHRGLRHRQREYARNDPAGRGTAVRVRREQISGAAGVTLHVHVTIPCTRVHATRISIENPSLRIVIVTAVKCKRPVVVVAPRERGRDGEVL